MTLPTEATVQTDGPVDGTPDVVNPIDETQGTGVDIPPVPEDTQPDNVGEGQEEHVSEPQDLNLIDIDEIQDPLVKTLHQQITSRFPNIDFNKAIGDAFEYGDKAHINAYYLQEVAGEAAPILQRQLETIYDIRETYVTDLVSSAHKVAGGEQAWQQSLTQFKAKAPKHVQAVVKGLVDSTNPDSHQEAIKFIVEFSKSNGLVDQRVNPVKGTQQTVGEPLGHAEYLKELAETHKIQNPTQRQAKKVELTKRRYGRQ